MDTDSSARRFAVRVIDVYPYRMGGDGPELLLLRRHPQASYAGTWRMVGGKIQPDETAWQAALRELREETGLTPDRCWTLPSLNQFYEWQHDRINLIPAFAAQVHGRPTLNHEHDTWTWAPVDEATRRLQWPEQQRLARMVASMCAQGIPEALQIPVDG
ncbi:MAG: NUDIX pyrophosphatase [Longimonas sp.]|uniref:NUDIX hydrolase n=1 Tax=Longimonas sp. TaxID=2039626 RepID=UPI00397515A6